MKFKLLGYFFSQNVHLISKYLLPEKISLLTSLQAEIKMGGGPKVSKITIEKYMSFWNQKLFFLNILTLWSVHFSLFKGLIKRLVNIEVNKHWSNSLIQGQIRTNKPMEVCYDVFHNKISIFIFWRVDIYSSIITRIKKYAPKFFFLSKGEGGVG